MFCNYKQKIHPRKRFGIAEEGFLASIEAISFSNTHTYTRLTALFLGVPRSASTRKVKPIWILLEQETVSGSGISWAICI